LGLPCFDMASTIRSHTGKPIVLLQRASDNDRFQASLAFALNHLLPEEYTRNPALALSGCTDRSRITFPFVIVATLPADTDECGYVIPCARTGPYYLFGPYTPASTMHHELQPRSLVSGWPRLGLLGPFFRAPSLWR